MSKNLKRFALVTLSIAFMLLLLTACGGSESPVETTETPAVESLTQSPKNQTEPESVPLPVEDNRLGVDLSDVVNSCPSGSLSYDGDITLCNLDNLIAFSVVGNPNNPEKFGVLFYASAYDNYQNEQVVKVLNMLNSNFFTNSIITTQDIILEATQSVLNNGETRYLSRDGYQIQLYADPSEDGGGSVAAYYVTK
jgi:hypothetical protein